MNYEAQKPRIVKNVTMEDIKTFFVKYIFSDKLGMIANAHLAKADFFEVGALHGQCKRLAQLHSDAVDFPKTGRPPEFPAELRATKFPDFMEKTDKPSYESQKVLGKLYRSINVSEEYTPQTNLNIENFDERLYVEGYEVYLDDARKLKRAYDADIRGLMNQFGIMTEIEVTSGYIVNTITKVDKKKPRDVTKSVMDALIPIKRQYRKSFEQEFCIEGSTIILPEVRNRMESKAYAWYYVAYHPSELGDDSSENMISFPWIAHDILCDIAVRNNHKVKGTRRVSTPQKAIFSSRNYDQDPFNRQNGSYTNNQQNGVYTSNQQNDAYTSNQQNGIYSSNQQNGTYTANKQNGTYNNINSIKQNGIYNNGYPVYKQNGIYNNINPIDKKNEDLIDLLEPDYDNSNMLSNGNHNQNYLISGSNGTYMDQDPLDDLMVDIERLKMSIKKKY
jgi:hypothetical protein